MEEYVIKITWLELKEIFGSVNIIMHRFDVGSEEYTLYMGILGKLVSALGGNENVGY